MANTAPLNVGIIGAGVAGLSAARLLLAQGRDCTLFERSDRLGGVWAAGYSNFGAQVQRELYEFPDYPLPDDATDFTPGPVLQKYLEDFARHFGMWQRIRFETTVVEVRERAHGARGWTVLSENGGQRREEEFDLVVMAIGLYSNKPHMPRFRGQEQFGGEIIHISELDSRERLVGKKVAVVGFGKSATDAAQESAAVAAQTTIVFRETHWPVPQKLLGLLPFKWAMLSRLTSTLIPLYYRPSVAERVVHSLGKPLVWFWWRLVELLLAAQCRLGSRFGTRLSLVPRHPVEIDTFGEAVMLPRPQFYPLVRKGVIQARQTEIAEYTPSGVRLQNDESLDLDVLILATGWETDYTFLSEKARTSIGFEEDGFYLYRQMVHPDVPDLYFIGSCAATIQSILTYSLQARWLAELVGGRHQLPTRDEMRRDIEELKAWKRRWMPPGGARGARLLLHMLHYHDQLVMDIGANPRRKRGIFAPFKEAFAPYQASDYRAILSGQWETEERSGAGPTARR